MKNYLFKGCATALITPFNEKLEVDYNLLEKLIIRQIDADVDAICVLGTTGEPSTLSIEERSKIIKLSRSLTKDCCKLIVGTGSNSTKIAIENTKIAKLLGADGALVVTPYYNKTNENGLFNHYAKISSSVDLPIILYNVPSRTGVAISPRLVDELAKIKNVVGLKEAGGNITDIIEKNRLLMDRIAIYSGDDLLNYTFLALGAMGSVSVISNAFPQKVREINDLALSGNLKKALAKSEKIFDLNELLKLDVNPIIIKEIMSQMGICENYVREPLYTTSQKNKNQIKKVLENSF